jgi:hypothetical protein
MEWKHYEKKIVEKYEVKLIGWPASRFDPHELGVRELTQCLEACRGPKQSCYWVKISPMEVDTHQNDIIRKMASGEIVTRECKQQSDAGKKRGLRTKDVDGSNKENLSPKKAWKGKAVCSVLIINSALTSDKNVLHSCFISLLSCGRKVWAT